MNKKTTTTQHNKNTPTTTVQKIAKPKNKKKLLLILTILLIIDLTITGFLKFGYNVVRCGGMPYKVLSSSIGFGGGKWYYSPGHYFPGGSMTTYYCTEQEAKNNGAVKDPFNGV